MSDPTMTSLSASRLEADSAAARLNGIHIAGGERVSAHAGRPLIHPADGSTSGHLAVGSASDVDAAVRNGLETFRSGAWSRRSPKERGQVLMALADLIDKHRRELALLETLDTGKPLTDALDFDIPSAAEMIRWYGQGIDKQYGLVAPTSRDAVALIRHVPLGVVGCITPWNFPLYQASYKIGPVLATGNSLVLKPSEFSPRSTLRVAELALEAGLPPGVLNVVTGDGRTGAALADHPDVSVVAFTGSPRTGSLVSRAAGAHLAGAHVEGGGKSAHVVLPDARDFDAIASAVVDGFCYNQGQVCSAGSRLIVPEDMADELLGLIVAETERYRLGDPFDTRTTLGPVVSTAHLASITDKIEGALTEGAHLLHRAEVPDLNPAGAWIGPVVLDRVDSQARAAQDEIFGPVLSVLRYDGDPHHAIDLANDTEYGLGAALWTRDVDHAVGLSRNLRAGLIFINSYDNADLTVPWGGFGLTGTGRDWSLEALDAYTASSTTWITVKDSYGATAAQE